ncbi:N-acyl-L-homoserine lactone (AHL) synthase (plasmid) [Agrobacterium salinitolerans]|uniref:acyl-homoserine-lactone synthase n=1 Tax=Agrobacterium salinitolerans TaxID=1183413 RepID=UPI001C2471B2|nr:acyl-homoserine-lactone synthase [Agrobacterium salinitolerans]QXC52988.1 N-acyl-L-homoserine lactone (AHL) synthase [Agrobacterium salinitolerans]
MFLLIQPYQYQRYSGLLEQSFRLRKRVFHDCLGWQVDVHDGLERDAYDGLGAVYLVWCDKDAHHLYGTVRLMPTTGPTLLRDVFSRTLPGKDLVSPGTWEGTRMCLDVDLLRASQPTLSPTRAFGLLLLALFECAFAHGIKTLVSNYEPAMQRVYRRAGLRVKEIGRADGYGRLPVCCGVFAVSDETLQKMRTVLRVAQPLYTRFLPAASEAAAGQTPRGSDHIKLLRKTEFFWTWKAARSQTCLSRLRGKNLG